MFEIKPGAPWPSMSWDYEYMGWWKKQVPVHLQMSVSYGFIYHQEKLRHVALLSDTDESTSIWSYVTAFDRSFPTNTAPPVSSQIGGVLFARRPHTLQTAPDLCRASGVHVTCHKNINNRHFACG